MASERLSIYAGPKQQHQQEYEIDVAKVIIAL